MPRNCVLYLLLLVSAVLAVALAQNAVPTTVNEKEPLQQGIIVDSPLLTEHKLDPKASQDGEKQVETSPPLKEAPTTALEPQLAVPAPPAILSEISAPPPAQKEHLDELSVISAPTTQKMEPEVRAIQLIYPSKDHELLLVNETSLAWLASFHKPVAIVAVSGPLHSGKSFLMNQLLNRTSGFALGPTTEPKTRGLWMWSAPVEVDDHLIVFLDTEGLFASNISEAYDAKIFAISSLMSSYLIYNSVKFIDQSSIDYIELLARRAQLFGIKAEISASEVEVENSFVSPPKLLWIVQDFVQEMEHGITPQEWLVSLLSSRKKVESTASSLPQLFESVDCFTLFLPEYRRDKLRHLDQVEDPDLLPEYRADMKLLREKVYAEAGVKTRGKNSRLTGLGAAALLRALVSAANQGAFPEVPSIWRVFLTLQTQTAIKDSVAFYEDSMDVQCSTHGPFNSLELHATHAKVVNETRHLFSRLTFGFKDLEEKNIEELSLRISRLYSTFESGNAANLTHLCQHTYHATRDEFRRQIGQLELPMKKSHLQAQLSELNKQSLAQYSSQLSRYRKESPYTSYLTELTSNMNGDRKGVELENSELLLQVIANASAEALAMCSRYIASQDPTEMGFGASPLKEHKLNATQLATRFFNKKAGFALEDLPTAPSARKALESDIQTILMRFDVTNAERIERRAQKIASKLAKEMTHLFDEIRLPQTRSIIQSKVNAIKVDFLAKYDHNLKDVIMMEPAKVAKEKLVSVAATDLQELFRRNDVKYDRIISDALPSLKQQIAPILEDFWWPPHAEEYARRAVNATLQSVELIENEDLVAELANRFIDANLREQIRAIRQKLILTIAVLAFVTFGAIFGLCFRRK